MTPEDPLAEMGVVIAQRLDKAVADATILELRQHKRGHDDSREFVFLYIDSPGGSPDAALQICAAMSELDCEVSTVCLNSCSGSATVILTAGTAGHRSALPDAKIALGPMNAHDTQAATEEEVQALVDRRRALLEIMHDCTGKPRDRIAFDIERGLTMTAEEAKEYGIVDGIFEKGGVEQSLRSWLKVHRAGKGPVSVPRPRFDHSIHYESPRDPCRFCRGVGAVQCPTCRGAGYVKGDFIQEPDWEGSSLYEFTPRTRPASAGSPKAETCPSCGGRTMYGGCMTCLGSGYVRREFSKRCAVCGGAKGAICPECRGSGRR